MDGLIKSFHCYLNEQQKLTISEDENPSFPEWPTNYIFISGAIVAIMTKLLHQHSNIVASFPCWSIQRRYPPNHRWFCNYNIIFEACFKRILTFQQTCNFQQYSSIYKLTTCSILRLTYCQNSPSPSTLTSNFKLEIERKEH